MRKKTYNRATCFYGDGAGFCFEHPVLHCCPAVLHNPSMYTEPQVCATDPGLFVCHTTSQPFGQPKKIPSLESRLGRELWNTSVNMIMPSPGRAILGSVLLFKRGIWIIWKSLTERFPLFMQKSPMISTNDLLLGTGSGKPASVLTFKYIYNVLVVQLFCLWMTLDLADFIMELGKQDYYIMV